MKFLAFIIDTLKNEDHSLFSFRPEQAGLSPEALKQVDIRIAVINVKRIVLFSTLIFIIEIINQIAVFLTTPFPAVWGLHFSAGVMMMLLTVTTILLAYRSLSAAVISVKCCRRLTLAFWWLFSVTMLLFIYVELYQRRTSNNFFYLLILTAAFPLLPRREISFLFLFDFTAVLPCTFYLGLSAQEIIQYPLITIFAWLLSLMLYSTYRMNEFMLEKLKGTNQELSDLAQTDPLTGLLNRRGIQTQLQRTLDALRGPVKVGFLMIDIDLFKKYNDRYGHEQGDRCLQKVSGAIRQGIRGQYDMASRFGGEEFLVILINCEKSNILETAQRLRKSVLSLQIEAADDEVAPYVTVSIGAAAAAVPFDFTSLYEQADSALYLAKASRRNCISMDGSVYKDRQTFS